MSEDQTWAFPESVQPKSSETQFDLERAFDAVVLVRAEVPDDAYSAATLGTERGGYGAVPPAYGEPSYDQAPPVGYPVPPARYYSPAPAPVYAPGYYPAPAYYYGPPRAYYAPPVISIGLSNLVSNAAALAGATVSRSIHPRRLSRPGRTGPYRR